MTTRQFTSIDRFIQGLDQAVRTVFAPPPTAGRANPAGTQADLGLDSRERELAGRLMRINHAGEIAAQGLYQGQAFSARLPRVRDAMEQAAREENDHLAWTAERIAELDSHTSWLDPVWYAQSFVIGALAGLAGDKWSLGFVAETEHQVVRHLDEHLARLPQKDHKSRAILEQMRTDEALHATTAIEAGAVVLPQPVKSLMGLGSKIMTRTAFWI